MIEILLRGTQALRSVGCHLYLVATADDDPDAIWVTESWESKQHHADSLQLPETRAAIAEAMPLLTGEFSGQDLTVVGGPGILKESQRVPATREGFRGGGVHFGGM